MSSSSSEPHPAAAIELRGVAKTYPGDPPVRALRPCFLRIEPGDYVAIMGPSGSGKSTLLNILGLLDTPSEGEYVLAGRDVSGLSEKQRDRARAGELGFVFQFFHLLGHYTSLENVQIGSLYGRSVPPRERARVAADLLTQVGLGHRLDARPTTLSGGERQRVAIARSLINRPSVLLCDEPTGNLDSDTSESILDLLSLLCREGQTVVIVTHDPDVARRANRLVTIRDGIVSEVGDHRPAVGV